MIILRRERELCVMCMGYLIVILEQTAISVELMVVFSNILSQGCKETFLAVAIP